jgi:predicted SnoaL-like aldol condensation-catalyzing enzyme
MTTQSNTQSTTGSRKEAAVDFLRLAASGNVRDAYARYVAPSFRHHNPYFRGDAASLQAGMAANAAEYPAKVFEVRRALAEGDLVAVHARVRLTPDGANIALIHIFRFEGDRIAEMWEAAQPVPATSANEYEMF